MQIKVNRQIAAVIIVYPNSLPFLKFANLNKGNAESLPEVKIGK